MMRNEIMLGGLMGSLRPFRVGNTTMKHNRSKVSQFNL
jgi:hypothetical protein